MLVWMCKKNETCLFTVLSVAIMTEIVCVSPMVTVRHQEMFSHKIQEVISKAVALRSTIYSVGTWWDNAGAIFALSFVDSPSFWCTYIDYFSYTCPFRPKCGFTVMITFILWNHKFCFVWWFFFLPSVQWLSHILKSKLILYLYLKVSQACDFIVHKFKTADSHNPNPLD